MEDDTELEAFYDAVRTMFLNNGWHLFLEDLRRVSKNLRDVTSVTDAEDLFYRQGQLNIVDFVLGYQESINAAQLASTEDDTDVDDV